MLLDGLNTEQKLAAETLEGPLLIIAGAGSGKTRAITYRIANLLEHGVEPKNILALTFTNKAAHEMKERINKLVTNSSEAIWVSTFHSFCSRVLRRDIEKIGYKRNFTIYDDDDQMSLIKSIVKEKGFDDKVYNPKSIKNIISDAKNNLSNADDWFNNSEKDYKASNIHDIFTLYNERLKKANALDFNDLILKTVELFMEQEPVLDAYRSRFKYVHVDEYQDTNYAQYKLVNILTSDNDNLCVVGDDDQSIYGWRGADIRNILDFEKDYPNAVVIKLEQNYRSTSNILNAANQVIAHNQERKEKNLWTAHSDGDLISLFSAGDEREEAAWICDRIQQMKQHDIKPNGLAVLYRTNAQSRVIEDMFIRAGIPYKVYGSQKFYDRKEIKDVLAYLRVISNPSDDVSLKRIINQPKRSIGNATIQELVKESNEENLPMFSMLYDIPETLSSRPHKCVEAFGNLLADLITASEEKSLTDFVSFLIEKTGLIKQYENDLSDEAKTRIENINELIGAIKEFEAQADNPTLSEYLENVQLTTDLDSSPEKMDFVALMTMHSAKGLEFDVVFVAGLEENLFPSYRSTVDEIKMEEERRLCYVALTRARKKLYLSFATSRTLYNQATYNKPSRFLNEIPENLLDQKIMNKREKSFPGIEMSTQKDRRRSNPNRITDYSQIGKPNIITPKGVKVLQNLPYVQKGFSASISRNIKTSSIKNIFKPGDRILHKKFGEGNVIEIHGSGRNARIKIEFAAYGTKEFSLSIAPIVKISE